MGDEAFILVHSPLVGPSTWSPVARALEEGGHRVAVPSLLGVKESKPLHWRWCVDRLVQAVAPEHAPVVLVGHSGAGPLLPMVSVQSQRAIHAYVFVDATIPARSGSTPIVPSELLPSLEARAENGWVPKWSRWWNEEAMRMLVPDDEMRRHLEEEMPSLPVTYFQEEVPVSAGWPDAACSYVLFSEAYDAAAADAESRGWSTRRLPGEHLHMVVDPPSVAKTLVDLVHPTATSPGPPAEGDFA
jgi:pimeloyl-ACP methyl ester carboxylesterase